MQEFVAEEDFRERPKELLVKCAEANTEKGSSTLVIAGLSRVSDCLNYAFIGDSGAGDGGFNRRTHGCS